MEKTLGDFVVALRKADFEVSPAETLDAMNALQIIGLEDRRLLRDTLSLVLAKTPDEKAMFQVCFDRFFSFNQFSPSHKGASVNTTAASEASGAWLQTEEGSGGENRRNRRRRGNKPGAHHTSKLGHLLLSGDAGELAVIMMQAANAVHLGNIKTLRERSLFTRRILIHMGLVQLEEEIDRLSARDDPMSRSTADDLVIAKHYVTEQVRQFVEEQYFLIVDGSGNRFLSDAVSQTKLTNMQAYYFDHIREAVRKLANQLAKKHAKRRRMTNRGQLDVRKTLRRNLQYDGALFDIKWKQIRSQRPKVFVLCDVSGSVKNVSRFLLTFLYSLSEVLPRVRAFAFSNDLGEVSELFERYGVDEAIDMSLDDYGKGSTDYGRAFHRFKELAYADIDNRSTVIILGDSRNNYFAPGTEALKQVSGKARQVIWLNPEPRQKWREGDAEMGQYLPYCHYAEVCNSLSDLEKMVSRVLRNAQ
ncbi:MAG: VWA domain-containing protein [Pseudomonadales bacterium]